MTFYMIQATLCHPADAAGYRVTTQVPTFYLSANVQGITSAVHAEEIARLLLNAANQNVTVNAIAIRQDMTETAPTYDSADQYLQDLKRVVEAGWQI